MRAESVLFDPAAWARAVEAACRALWELHAALLPSLGADARRGACPGASEGQAGAASLPFSVVVARAW